MPGASPFAGPAAGVPAVAAGSGCFFANRPLTSLLPKALAAEPTTEPPAPLPAALLAAVPAAAPAAPAAEPVAAFPAACPASPTAFPLLAELCVPCFAAAQCSPPNAMRTTVLSG